MEAKPRMASTKRRLFLGIPLPEDVKTHLAKQIEKFPGKIIPLQNWHLTLHFLGNVEEERLTHIHNALQSISLGKPFALTFDHLGGFPHPRRARTLWVGAIEGTDKLRQLVQITGETLATLGFAIDPRPYIPHLTVSRFYRPQHLTDLIKDNPLESISMEVNRFILYE